MLKIDLLSVCVKIVAHQFSGKLDIRLFICTNAPLGVQLGVLKSKKKKKKENESTVGYLAATPPAPYTVVMVTKAVLVICPSIGAEIIAVRQHVLSIGIFDNM